MIKKLIGLLLVTTQITIAQVTDTGDKVGIGTTTPTEKLDINGNIIVQGYSASNDGPLAALKFYNRYTSSSDVLAQIQARRGVSSHQKGDLAFYVKDGSNLIESFRIASNGNIGISTTTPSARLDLGTATALNQVQTILARQYGGDNNFDLQVRSGSGTLTNSEFFKLGINYGNTLNSNINFFRGGGVNGGFMTFSTNNDTERMRINANGYIGIGTTTPDSKLTVAGKVHAQEVKVTVTAGADFVFEESYQPPTLKELESFIKTNKHLPEIASAKEMETEGLELGEMNIKLLQKIEELTLYTIEQEKKIQEFEKEKKLNEEQSAKIEKLENLVKELVKQ